MLEQYVAGISWQAAAIACGGVVVLCWWVAYWLRRKGVLWGGYAFSAGALMSVMLCRGESAETALAVGALCLCAAAVSQASLAIALALRNARRRRQLRERVQFRQVGYALPNGGNAYLRERLETVLCEDREEGTRRMDVDVDYALQTAAQLLEMGLSTVDELQVKELTKSIGVLTAKGELTAREQTELNVCLSALLKLSAKYQSK